MSKICNDKQKQINDIVSVVKLCSLLFSGIVFFKYNFKGDGGEYGFNYLFSINLIILYTLLLSMIYLMWSFSTVKKFDNEKYINLIRNVENFLFILIFIGIVMISGKNLSQYKFIFLFIILTSSIQSGMKQGLSISIISSAVILAIDMIYAPGETVNQYFENDLILSGVFLLTAWPLGFYVKIEKEHIEKLEGIVNIDGLTQVFNHRYFHDALKEKISYGDKSNKPVALVFLDIDYFKYYNDLYGHLMGDKVLKKIGVILKSSTREKDIVARYGGEEFAVIMPDTNEEEALKLAEVIRREIEKAYFEGEENQPNGRLTASIGISIYPDKAKNDLELINSADDALYRAKFFNKNRVEAYTSILDDLKKDIDEEHIDLVTSIKTLISVINAKDKYTYSHVERVVIYCRLMADKLGLCEEEKKKLIFGAYMHDIGKINIAKEILIKKMPPSAEEWEMLKQHPSNGAAIIEPVESLRVIVPLILHHHERYDGKGYPDGLAGEDIPYLARVLTIADSFDAMTSKRSYTNLRKTYEEAAEELRACSGTQFDPELTEIFIRIIEGNKDSFDEYEAS
ncbi:MAG: diguanylate cyclase protein [Firmicutes bacterium]|nr:diguanylate cyclase protein [Bacillota bacterium]